MGCGHRWRTVARRRPRATAGCAISHGGRKAPCPMSPASPLPHRPLPSSLTACLPTHFGKKMALPAHLPSHQDVTQASTPQGRADERAELVQGTHPGSLASTGPHKLTWPGEGVSARFRPPAGWGQPPPTRTSGQGVTGTESWADDQV